MAVSFMSESSLKGALKVKKCLGEPRDSNHHGTCYQEIERRIEFKSHAHPWQALSSLWASQVLQRRSRKTLFTPLLDL